MERYSPIAFQQELVIFRQTIGQRLQKQQKNCIQLGPFTDISATRLQAILEQTDTPTLEEVSRITDALNMNLFEAFLPDFYLDYYYHRIARPRRTSVSPPVSR